MSHDPADRLAETARLLGATPYPEGRAWRCSACGFACDDSGPDFCPHDGGPLVRTMLSFSQTGRWRTWHRASASRRAEPS